MVEEKCWEKSDLEGIKLARQDLDYLCNNGLKVGSFGFIKIYPEFEMSGSHIVLAYDSDVPIVCLGNGEGVFSVENAIKRFVNSSVEQFARTVERFSKYCELVQEVDSEEEALGIVNSAIDGMKKIDSTAWSSDLNYWPIVGQQMVEGNL